VTGLPAAIGATAAIVFCFVVPGITWGPVLAPGRLSDLTRVGRAVGAGLAVSAVVATVLVGVGRLEPVISVAALIVATVLPLASRSVRRDLLGTVRARRRPAPLLLGAAALVAIALHLVLSHLRLGPESLPATSTVWYYRHLAELVGATGGLPAQFPEWGGLRPFHTDYLPFTAHSALVFSLMGLDRAGGLEAYRLAVLAATILVAALLFRRWLPTWIALLGALLLVTTLRMDWKLLSYKPETFGLLLGLFALWLLDRAAVERSWRLAASAAMTFGLVVMSHAEVAIVLLPAVAGIAIARGVGRPSGGRLGLGFRTGRRLLGSTLIPIVATTAGLIGGLVVNAGLTGEAGLLGYVLPGGGGVAAEVRIDPDLLPDGWDLSADPTWNFHTAAVARGQEGTAPPTRFTDQRLLSREILHVWPGVDARTLFGAVALALIVLVPALAWPRLDRRRRGFLVFGAVFAVGLLAGAWLLTELSSTYVPRRIGPRRLLPYELLVPVGAAMATAFLAARATWTAAGRGRLGTGGRRIAGGLVLVLLLLVPLVPTVGAADDEESGGLSASGAAAYEWLEANLPEDARILANAYTDGSLTLLSGRLGVLDGRAVYLEDPEFLAEATGLLLGGRRFYADPSNPGSDEYLALADPDFLLVATNPRSGVDLGGYRPFVTDLQALDSDPRLELVRELADGGLRLYRVGTGDGTG
jgi:Dolichyl-phosphate-mannose-protein mannosyltransferase